MNFKEACKRKFNKGAKEHGQTWDIKHINPVKELMDELTDIAN